MKHIVVVDSFRNQDTINMILRIGREDTRFITATQSGHNSFNHNDVIYAEDKYQRYIAADKWQESEDHIWYDMELIDFMEEMGPQYQYHSPSAFAFSLYKSMTPEYQYLIQDGFKGRMCAASLYGGRCEVLQFGTFQAHQYDINSSYPFASISLSFPDPRHLHIIRPSIDNIYRYDGVSRICFSQNDFIPILPLRIDGRLYYADADHAYQYKPGIETTYNHTELRYALDNGVRIHNITRQYIADSSNLRPFTRFMQLCYDNRERSGRRIWKVIANSLIGRMAIQQRPINVYRPAVSEDELKQTEPHRIGWYGVWCIADEQNWRTDSNLLWASMIMSKARQNLHRVVQRSHTVYMDTDCAFTLHERSCYDIGTGIGQLKHDSGEYNIKGAKLYTRTGEDNITVLKMKGVSKLYRNKDTYDRARYTSERFMYPDGTTRPYQYDNEVLV